MKLILILFLLQLLKKIDTRINENDEEELQIRDLEREFEEELLMQQIRLEDLELPPDPNSESSLEHEAEMEERMLRYWKWFGGGIVHYQNVARSTIASNGIWLSGTTERLKAANMNKLVFDRDLMIEARQIVRQNPSFPTLEHRRQGVVFFRTVHLYTNDELLIQDVWQKNFDKILEIVSNWSPEFYTLEMFSAAADAFQMMLATATKVGCYGKLYDGTQAEAEDLTFVVCKYDQAARVSRQIFKLGPACSRCPSGFSCNDTLGLCDRRE